MQLSSVHDFMDQNQPHPVETWTTAQGYGTRLYGPSHPIMAQVRPSGQFMQDVRDIQIWENYKTLYLF